MLQQTHRDIIKGWHPFRTEDIQTYVTKGIWTNHIVSDLLDRNAALYPHKLAIVDDTREVTWKQLQIRSKRMALSLKHAGIEYGDFFILQMTNVVEFFYFFFGLNRIGAIPVMNLPRHRKLEINHVLKLHKAKGICVMGAEPFDFAAMVAEIKPQHPYLKICCLAGGDANEGWLSVDELISKDVEARYDLAELDGFKPDPNDICCQQLSGGSTGLPKAIPRTHNDYIAQWRGYARLAGNTEDSVALITIPVAHNAAFLTMTGPMSVRGGTIVLTKSPRPRESFGLVEKYGVTDTMLIPVQIIYWKEADNERQKHDLSSLRVMGAAAQKVRPELVDWCLTELGVDMVNHFGMAEGPMICNRWNSPKEPQMYTVGYPMYIDPEAKIKIVDYSNQDLGPGEIGELVAKGFLNFRGYFRNPEENKKTFDEKGFFHTGDLLSKRPDGRFVVEGRKKDMVIRGGENVYPEAVEDLLVRHSKIMCVAVVGMPDYKLGERLCAYVQPKPGESITFDEVIQFMHDNGMAIFQLPERIEILDGWPLTPVNKIDKRRLRVHITVKLFEEGLIEKAFGNEYLTREKISIDDVLSGKNYIEFTGSPM